MEPLQGPPRSWKRPRLEQRSSSSCSDAPPPPPPYQPTPPECLFPLLLHIVPPGGIVIPPIDPTVGPQDSATTPTEYDRAIDRAIARVKALDSYLTPSMISSLSSLISVIGMHLSPADPTIVHPFIANVLSDDTPDNTLQDWANTIDRGLRVFAARGGKSSTLPDTPSPTASVRASTTRSQKVHRGCAERDNRTCAISRKQIGGVVAHVLPFSLRDSKAGDFWGFFSLFRGVEETEELKTLALGPGQDTDGLTNVFWLAEEPHSYFDNGWIAIVPQLMDSYTSYDPNTATEYTAQIEFPFGSRKAHLIVWKYVDGEPEPDKVLKTGDTIHFTTHDPARLPLPHPLVFQLHAIVSRVMAMKAAAGYPVFADPRDWDSDEEYPLYYGETIDHETHDREGNEYDRPLGNDPEVHTDSIIPCSGGDPYVQRWLLSEPSPHAPPLLPLCGPRKRRRTDDSRILDEGLKIVQDDDSSSDGERPRRVDVVQAEEKMRAEDRLRILAERFGSK